MSMATRLANIPCHADHRATRRLAQHSRVCAKSAPRNNQSLDQDADWHGKSCKSRVRAPLWVPPCCMLFDPDAENSSLYTVSDGMHLRPDGNVHWRSFKGRVWRGPTSSSRARPHSVAMAGWPGVSNKLKGSIAHRLMTALAMASIYCVEIRIRTSATQEGRRCLKPSSITLSTSAFSTCSEANSTSVT